MEIVKYVINLESRSDRRRLIERQLRSVGWRASFSQSQKPSDAAGFPSAGARGCFVSHLAMLTKGLEHAGSHVLIMEDDLKFSACFSDRWQRCIEALKVQDWDMLYAGHYQSDLQEGLNLLPPTVPISCTHFMLFNERIISTLIDNLQAMLRRPPGDPLGGPMHVDGAYSLIRARNPEIRTFAYAPSLGSQRPSRSDIAPNFILDRLSLLNPSMLIYRRIKEALRSSS
jgi:hypothetical protein